jgi:hypothetical protein
MIINQVAMSKQSIATNHVKKHKQFFTIISVYIFYSKRSFIRKHKHRTHPNNVIIEERFGIVVLKATTAVSNFLTTCAVVDGS